MIYLMYIIVVLTGYLVGSIPFGVLIGRIFAKTDIRQVGSGKTGMTNVLRAAGKKAAALALVLDIGKGVVTVILAGLLFNSNYVASLSADSSLAVHYAQVLAAMAAVGGHSWSIFLKFKGGRGVNTFVGGLFAMYWPAAVVGGGIMIIVGAISRYMSLGSITGAIVAFIMLIIVFILKSYAVEYLAYTFYAMIGSIFIFLMHRDNVIRLISGTERKIGENSGANSPSLSTGQD